MSGRDGWSDIPALRSEWRTWICGLIAISAVALASPTFAEDRPSFGDLLSRAQAQAAAGHRWSPAGDNMTETIAAMMNLLQSATPTQLASLSELLETDASRLPPPTAPGGMKPVSGSVATETSVPPDRGLTAPNPPIPLTPDMGMTDRGAPGGSVPDRGAPGESVTDRDAPGGSVADRGAVGGSVTDRGAVGGSVPDRGAVGGSVTDHASTGRNAPNLGASGLDAPDRVAPEPPAPRRSEPVVVRPGPRAAELFARGQEAERAGDVSGARRYYAAAADQGSPTAARSLGRLYDPAYLKQTAMGGIDPDAVLARRWYERAVAMGDTQAAPLLQALAAR